MNVEDSFRSIILHELRSLNKAIQDRDKTTACGAILNLKATLNHGEVWPFQQLLAKAPRRVKWPQVHVARESLVAFMEDNNLGAKSEVLDPFEKDRRDFLVEVDLDG